MPYIGISYRIPWYHKLRHCHFILTAITFRMVKNLGLPILGKLVRRMAENGFAPPPREFCRHILSCRELKAKSYKRCLHSVLRGVSL